MTELVEAVERLFKLGALDPADVPSITISAYVKECRETWKK